MLGLGGKVVRRKRCINIPGRLPYDTEDTVVIEHFADVFNYFWCIFVSTCVCYFDVFWNPIIVLYRIVYGVLLIYPVQLFHEYIRIWIPLRIKCFPLYYCHWPIYHKFESLLCKNSKLVQDKIAKYNYHAHKLRNLTNL